VTSRKPISSRSLERFETFWPKAQVRRQVDQLYWRAKNRYIALRGASEAGKSTILNLLLGVPMLRTSLGQTTGCITEIRPVTLANAQGHVHLVSEAQLERRLDALKGRKASLEESPKERKVSDAEYGDYRRAASRTREILDNEKVTLGETLTENDWGKLGFSEIMGQGKMHEIVIDRVTIPVPVPAGHPLRWAAEKGVSFLDLPGDAQGEVFNGIILEEALTSYAPYATVRVWRADKVDRPETKHGELLAITFLDSADAYPEGPYAKTIRGTLQDYESICRTAQDRGPFPFVISAAMDAPAGVDFGLAIGKGRSGENLRAWQEWLSRPEQADDDAYQRLLAGVRQSLTGGGTAALNDYLQQRLDTPDQTVESEEIQQLARAVVTGLRALQDELKEPLSPEEELRKRILEEQEARQARRLEIQEAARSHVYGAHRSPPWQKLATAIDSGWTEDNHPGLAEELAKLISEHADAAQLAACHDLGIPADSPQLARLAQPLIKALAELIASAESTPESLPTWVDVARVRWELSNLLAALMVEADPHHAPSPEPEELDFGPDEERDEREREYRLREGVLNDCIAWAGSFG
jgi:Dynamin family